MIPAGPLAFDLDAGLEGLLPLELVEGDPPQAGEVLGGVAPIPWRVANAEKFLADKSLSAEVLTEVARLALEGAQPLEKNAYKIPLTQTLVRRALTQAVNGRV